MAIKPDEITEWTDDDKINAGDTDYPYGSAKRETSEGSDDGTTYIPEPTNDLWGFLQALLVKAGITPSGNPDTAVASQYMQAFFESAIFDSDAIDNISLTKMSDGDLDITRDVTGEDWNLKISPGNIIMDNTSDASLEFATITPKKLAHRFHDNFVEFIAGALSAYEIAGNFFTSLTAGEIKVSFDDPAQDYVKIKAQSAGGSYVQTYDGPTTLETQLQGKGISYSGEGSLQGKNHRTKAIDLSSIVTSTPANTLGYRLFPGSLDTGLDAATTAIKGATIRYLNTGDKYTTAGATLDDTVVDGGSGNWSATSINIDVDKTNVNGAKIDGGFAEEMVLWIDYYFI